MELLSGYSDAGLNAFNAGQNAIQNNLMNNISAQQLYQQQQMAGWNATAAAMTQPTPYGYGFVGGYPSFNEASGGGGGGGGDVWSQGAPAYQDYGGGANPGGFSPSPNYPGGGGLLPGQQSALDDYYRSIGMVQTGLPGNQSPSNYFDTLTQGAGYNPYTGPSAGYNPYDAASYGLGTSWQAPAQPNSMALLGYDPNASAQWAPGQSWSAPTMNSGGGAWDLTQEWGGPNNPLYWTMKGLTPPSQGGGGYIDPGNIDRYRGGEAYGQPSANPSYFDPSSYYGAGGGGGYDPWRSAALPAYDPNSFADRFAAGGYYNPGTPSQYTTDTYRDVGGIAYPGGMAPTGYQGLYGMDDPTGALPLEAINNPNRFRNTGGNN